jgi:uncharacterized protein YcfJ
MRKTILAASLLFAATLTASAGNKLQGTMTLKDLQPFGTTDKEHKHQAYDLSFQAQGNSYTCRTDSGKSTNATDFVVGTDMKYQIDGNKAKIKTPQDKELQCKIVRVEKSPTP